MVRATFVVVEVIAALMANSDCCAPAASPRKDEAWLASARVARRLSWLSLAWMTLEGGLGFTAASVPVLGAKLESRATAGEGGQNMLCAYLAAAVLVGLGANALLGWWWLDPVIGLAIAAQAVREGREAWRGEACC